MGEEIFVSELAEISEAFGKKLTDKQKKSLGWLKKKGFRLQQVEVGVVPPEFLLRFERREGPN